MLISEFSEVSGLSRDTVRFYVRLGLLKPKRGTQGGRNAYQHFGDEDLQTAKVIRAGQSLGLSLNEITLLEKERREHGIGPARRIEILRKQLALLEEKKAQLEAVTAYVASKIEWLAEGKKGARPSFGVYECRDGEE